MELKPINKTDFCFLIGYCNFSCAVILGLFQVPFQVNINNENIFKIFGFITLTTGKLIWKRWKSMLNDPHMSTIDQ